MLATGETVGLAEWIIDDTCLVVVVTVVVKTPSIIYLIGQPHITLTQKKNFFPYELLDVNCSQFFYWFFSSSFPIFAHSIFISPSFFLSPALLSFDPLSQTPVVIIR